MSRFPEAYSPSKLKKAAECGAAYQFAYINKLPYPAKGSIALGRWLDEAANVAWAHKLEKKESYGHGRALDYALSTFKATVTDAVPEWDLDTDPETIRDRLLLAYGEYLGTWYDRLIPHSVQAWCGLEPGVIGRLGLRGRIDLVSREPEGLVVNDLKVKGKGFYAQKDTGPSEAVLLDLQRDMQMMSYAAALAEEGEAPVKVRLIGLIWTAKPQVQTVEIAVTASMIRWVLNAAKGAAAVIEQERFYPNPLSRFCSTCSYTKECTEKFGSMELTSPRNGG